MVFGHCIVEDSERFHHVAVAVGEEGVGDSVVGGEVRERFDRIVADGVGVDAVGTQTLEILLQLHELDLTEASPGSVAVEQDEAAVFPVGRVGGGAAVLVGKFEDRN